MKEKLTGININQKYLQKNTMDLLRSLTIDFLIDPCFQGVNRLFVLSFENETQRRRYKQYYLPTAEIENYNVMID